MSKKSEKLWSDVLKQTIEQMVGPKIEFNPDDWKTTDGRYIVWEDTSNRVSKEDMARFLKEISSIVVFAENDPKDNSGVSEQFPFLVKQTWPTTEATDEERAAYNKKADEEINKFLKEAGIEHPSDADREFVKKHERTHAAMSKLLVTPPSYVVEGENEPDGEGNGWYTCDDKDAKVFRIWPTNDIDPALDEVFDTRAEAEAWVKENLEGETK